MVYIIKSTHNDYDSSYSFIVGLCESQKDAFKYSIKNLIKTINYDDYDPRNRYYSFTDYSPTEKRDILRHTDMWETSTGCGQYSIEEWILNSENGKKLNSWYINIDKMIKTCIIENKLENKIIPNTIENFINSLETQLDTIDYCMEEKINNFGLPWSKRKPPTDDVIKKWNKLYDKNPDDEIYGF